MAPSILVVGGVCRCEIIHLDALPEPRTQHLWSKRTHHAVGHMGAGKAFNFAKLGFHTTLHAFAGRDAPGAMIARALEAQGVTCAFDDDPAGTETQVNLMDGRGERISITTNGSTFDPPLDRGKVERLISRHDHVAINVVNYTRHLLPLVRAQGKELWCDLGDFEIGNRYLDDFVEGATHVTMSSVFLPDHRRLMWQLRERGMQLVVCTHGARGSTGLTADGEWIDVPCIDAYPLVDANGAGDSFFAGLLFARTRGYDVKRSMRLATVVAGLTVSSHDLYHPALSPGLVEEEYRRHYRD